MPEALGSLGLSRAEIETHIGWDIGAAAVARRLSELLGAALVLSGYSRLVIDCNRPTDVPGSMPAVSGGVTIPGNQDLDTAAREARIRTFFQPYHAAISALLDERTAHPGGPVLLSIHSFTPELLGRRRPWNVGMLYGEDTRLAHPFRDMLRRDSTLNVGDNEPYRVSAGTDYTIPVHGEARGILHTAIEIRQDGVADERGTRAWADRIASIAREILAQGGILPVS